jgi:protein-disulfide isomerase
VYRDFPLVDIHPGALMAAHVANCAGDQGGFWPMHDRLFSGAAERAWGKGDAADFQTFLGYAAELELDVPALRQCVEVNHHAPSVEADFADGARRGVRSTPTFTINGKLLVGAQPFSVWREILEDLLTKM